MQRRPPEHRLKYIICHCIHASHLEEVYSIFQTEGVSAHYLITPEGKTTEYVPPEFIAHHAGVSAFGELKGTPLSSISGSPTLNFTSLGIEFLSPGYAKNGQDWYHFEPFTPAQKEAGLKLILDLMKRFNIASHHVLGHSDIAPLRKTDPGARFFWDDLALHNIGLPLPPPNHTGKKQNVSWVQECLREIGYVDTPQTGILDKDTMTILLAFQQHFVPAKFNDPEYVKLALKGEILDLQTYGALEFLRDYKIKSILA